MLKQLNLKEIAFIQRYTIGKRPSSYSLFNNHRKFILSVLIGDRKLFIQQYPKFIDGVWIDLIDYDLTADFKAAEIVQNLEWLIEQNNCKNNELTEIS